jgi:hypothetical protein
MKYPNTRSPVIRNARKDSGSALVIALTFACIITFGIAGILPLVLTDWKLSSRISGQEAAFSLAESGLEEAIWAILEFGEDESAWTSNGWNESANDAYWYREWNLSDYTDQLSEIYELDDNRVGSFRVVVQKVGEASENDVNIVNIVSQGIVTGGKNVANDYRASRYIETQFKRLNPFEYGAIAKKRIDFNGQPEFDSYNSDSEEELNWADFTRTENITVGSASTNASDIALGNATIHGDLATGSSDDDSDSVRGNALIDGNISYDFEMELPIVSQPDTSGFGWLNQL